MNIILLLLLMSLLFFSLYVNHGNIMSPWFIGIAVFFFSALVASLNMDDWGVSINGKTVVIIISALFFLGVGEYLGKIPYRNNRTRKTENTPKNYKIYMPKYILIIALIIQLISVYLSFYALQNLASLIGARGTGLVLHDARYAILTGRGSLGPTVGIFQFMNTSIGYLSSYILINNFFRKKNYIEFIIKNSPYFFSIILLLISEVLGTNRTGIIYYVVMFVGLVFLNLQFTKKYRTNIKTSLRMVFIIIFVIILFFAAFNFMGMLTGKTQSLGVLNAISLYAGSSIIALDIYLVLNGVSITNGLFGEETLQGIYNLFEILGVSFKENSRHLEFVYFSNGMNTNVYTAIRRYLSDYSLIGMVFIMLLMGYFYSKYYSIISARRNYDIWVIVYCYLLTYLVMISIDDLFLSSLFTITQIFVLFFIFLFYKLFIRKVEDGRV